MNWLRKRIVNWMNQPSSTLGADSVVETHNHHTNPGDFNLSVMQAMNGKVIQIRTYAPHTGPGPDWKSDLYLVAEGEKMTDALATLMVLKNLERA